MITWVIDANQMDRHGPSGHPNLAVAAREAGHCVYELKTTDLGAVTPLLELGNPCPVIGYGSIPFITQLNRRLGKNYCPGSYFNENVKTFSTFAANYGALMLNDDFVIVPFGEFVRRGISRPKFIKPNKGFKEFTGFVVKPESFADEISSMNQLMHVDPESLVVVAEPKNIHSEYRYVIVDGKVVTGSEYRWDNVLDVRSDTHTMADEMAEAVANWSWQPDRVYVVDVALETWSTQNQFNSGRTLSIRPKIVELNAFSSSGLYAMDTGKIVEAVSKAALSEYNADEPGEEPWTD